MGASDNEGAHEPANASWQAPAFARWRPRHMSNAGEGLWQPSAAAFVLPSSSSSFVRCGYCPLKMGARKSKFKFFETSPFPSLLHIIVFPKKGVTFDKFCFSRIEGLEFCTSLLIRPKIAFHHLRSLLSKGSENAALSRAGVDYCTDRFPLGHGAMESST